MQQLCKYLHNGYCLRHTEIKMKGNQRCQVVAWKPDCLQGLSTNSASDLRVFPFSVQKFHKSSPNHSNLSARAPWKTTPIKNKWSESQRPGCHSWPNFDAKVPSTGHQAAVRSKQEENKQKNQNTSSDGAQLQHRHEENHQWFLIYSKKKKWKWYFRLQTVGL